MREEIIKTIATIAEISPTKINMNSNLIKDLDLESLDLVTLVSTFEEKYHITVEDKDIKDLQTVADVVNYISSHV